MGFKIGDRVLVEAQVAFSTDTQAGVRFHSADTLIMPNNEIRPWTPLAPPTPAVMLLRLGGLDFGAYDSLATCAASLSDAPIHVIANDTSSLAPDLAFFACPPSDAEKVRPVLEALLPAFDALYRSHNNATQAQAEAAREWLIP
jgi:hypothetical protein